METGDDPVGLPYIELSPAGTPRWVTSYVPREDVAEDAFGDNLLALRRRQENKHALRTDQGVAPRQSLVDIVKLTHAVPEGDDLRLFLVLRGN